MQGWIVLVVFAVGWFFAQLSKVIIGLTIGRKSLPTKDWRSTIGYLMRSGGMPSGHTASLTAAALYLGLSGGFDSALFAFAVCMWLIVVYDAINVRYAVGEQGKALNKLLKKANQAELPVVEGHTVPQVLVGALIGAAVAVITFVLVG